MELSNRGRDEFREDVVDPILNGFWIGIQFAYYVVVIATCGRFMGWW